MDSIFDSFKMSATKELKGCDFTSQGIIDSVCSICPQLFLPILQAWTSASLVFISLYCTRAQEIVNLSAVCFLDSSNHILPLEAFNSFKVIHCHLVKAHVYTTLQAGPFSSHLCCPYALADILELHFSYISSA